ncbi:MAG: transporter related protein [Armatimonadetes bacterium]|nr:transporter related protein [Armatimonadota bacterium]
MPEPTRTDFALFRRLFWESRKYLPRLGGVLFLQLLGTPLTLLVPVPMKLAVDSVIHQRPLPPPLAGWLPWAAEDPRGLLLLVCGLSLVIALANQLQSLSSSLLTVQTSQCLLLDFRSRMFLHAERLSLLYHTKKGTADTQYRIQSDATALEWLFVDGAIPLLNSTFSLVSMLYVVLRLNWKIGCTALVIAPALFMLTRATRPLMRRQSRELKKQESAALGIIQEVLGVLRVVKAFGQEERERDRYAAAADRCVQRRIRLTLADGTLGLLINMIAAVGLAAVLYFGVNDVLAGALTLGEMLLISSYISQLYAPLKTLSRKSVNLQTQLASAERALGLLDEPVDVPEPETPRPLERAGGAIEFRNVSFSYDGKRQALQDVSFQVPAGARVGIVGATGAGKTTLTYLMMRFGDPDGGAVLLDGVDLREYSVNGLRGQFAMVFQEPVLFATSIAENIAYARPDATMDEIIAAAEAANIHHFISELPDGYASRVGERGMSLSGGERQRIGLARAFLRDSPILILDEPTSSVDMRTEELIMESVERLMQGRTTFIIAHRLNTLDACDQVLQVEGGRVTLRPPGERLGPAVVTAAQG